MQFARGEFLTVYDAEDRPEPDQLRKVVATFRQSSANTACLQCRLNYFNANENWLTRMFTLDYTLWFDQILPGLERLNVPIPLGGTSNHFKIDVLRELYAWDPFNVTEGRRSRHPPDPKGLSCRHRRLDDVRGSDLPGRAIGSASARAGSKAICRPFWSIPDGRCISCAPPGRSAFFGFVFFIGGTALSGLLNPVFWVLYLVWLLVATSGLDPIFPQVLLFLALFNLLAGNGTLIFLHMLAPIRRGWLHLIPIVSP